VLVGANAHLLYVAVTSQPDCVPHVRPGDARSRSFSARKSACCRSATMSSTIPAVMPPLPRDSGWTALPPSVAFDWLAAAGAISDAARRQPALWLGVFLVSRRRRRPRSLRLGLHPVPGLRRLHGGRPDLAVGLYEKSRRLAAGEPVTLPHDLRPPASGGQILFTGVLLCC
jgi:hypothetical protein